MLSCSIFPVSTLINYVLSSGQGTTGDALTGCRERRYGTALTLTLRQVYFILCRGRGRVAITAKTSLTERWAGLFYILTSQC